jgi:hypothetical protein
MAKRKRTTPQAANQPKEVSPAKDKHRVEDLAVNLAGVLNNEACPDLRSAIIDLTELQQENLERFWYAVSEMSEVLPMPGHSSGRCEALRIIAESVGCVFQELNDQKISDAVAEHLLEARK